MHKIFQYDQTGDLRHGAFWEFEIPSLLDESLLDDVFPPRYSNPPTPPIWGKKVRELVRAEVVETRVVRTIRKCQLNPEHVTHIYQNMSVDLYTGHPFADFVPAWNSDGVIVTKRVKEMLASTELRAYSLSPLAVECCQPYEVHDVPLWTVNFEGASCCRNGIVVPPNPNVCPFCEFGPLVCPGCDVFERCCPSCGKKTIVIDNEHEGSSDPRYIVESPPPQGRILDGRHWDGGDFLGGYGSGFVSSRVIRWLLDNDLCPFVAWPARMDLVGMSEEQHNDFDRLAAIDLHSGLL